MKLRHLFCFIVLVGLAETTLSAQSDWPKRNEIAVSTIRLVTVKNRFGVSVGYTSALAHIDASVAGGTVETRPGFEAGLIYQRVLGKWRSCLQTGITYVSRDVRLSGLGATFNQHNDWLSVPLLFVYRPIRNNPTWMRRFQVKAGIQVGMIRLRTPATTISAPTGVQNVISRRNQPEALAVGELSYYLPRIRQKNQSIALAYAYGWNAPFHGSVESGSQTAFRYSNAGTYLSLKYTIWISRDFKTR